MKKSLILVALVLVTIVSCTSNDEPKKVFKVDPTAMINIRISKNAVKSLTGKSVISDQHLSALEIVKQTANLNFYNIAVFGNQQVGRGFSMPQRDTITPMLKMWGTDIISDKGELVNEFLEGNDVVLERLFFVINKDTLLYNPIKNWPLEHYATKVIRDTVAYIPNSVMNNARTQIKAAFSNNDHQEVYRLFNEAFTFIPINGKEYRALKKLGQN